MRKKKPPKRKDVVIYIYVVYFHLLHPSESFMYIFFPQRKTELRRLSIVTTFARIESEKLRR
jgi:hypothetical protein